MTFRIAYDPHAVHNLYFESVAVVITLILLGKFLERRSKAKTADAIKKLVELSPDTAVVLKDGKETEINASDLKTGDEFIIKAGACVPVDGIIIKGECSLDESALTGESIPRDKAEGDKIFSSTTLKSGYAVARAEKIGEDTAFSKIIKTVSDAMATKAPIAKIADTVSGFFVPTVILIAFITTVIWLAFTRDFAYSLEIDLHLPQDLLFVFVGS